MFLTYIMAFTRFHDDPDVIQKKLCEMTFEGVYQLNVPGNGLNNPYIEDPNIRLQKWGANLHSNTIEIDSKFKGLDRKLTSDYQQYTEPNSFKQSYSSNSFSVDESRASHPAWLYRDLSQYRPAHLYFNPQYNTTLKFENNQATRILEKDYYRG